jgi:hypothetical protein
METADKEDQGRTPKDIDPDPTSDVGCAITIESVEHGDEAEQPEGPKDGDHHHHQIADVVPYESPSVLAEGRSHHVVDGEQNPGGSLGPLTESQRALREVGVKDGVKDGVGVRGKE